MRINVIIPVYNEESALAFNFDKIYSELKQLREDVHYILVDDGSVDSTWAVVENISKNHVNVEGIKFARNYGKEAALMAGISQSKADRYITMDSDLQHPPKHIGPMMALMDESKANIIEGVKNDRGVESFKYKVFAKSFYKLLHKMSNLDMDGSSDFKIMDSKVIDSITKMQETNIFFRGLVHWVGFKSEKYYFDVEDRLEGESSFSTFRLMRLAMDAVFSYTSKPLYITLIISLIFVVLGSILGIQTLINFMIGNAVSGFSTVIILILISSGLILFSLGIIGVYIARIYDEVKGRPQYILSEKTAFKNIYKNEEQL